MPFTVRFAATPADLEAAYRLRRDVFETEQNVPRPLDRDGLDERATHAIAYDDAGQCVGTGRVVRGNSRTGHIGRQAVAAAHRRNGVGAAVLDALERMAVLQGLRELTVNAQLPAEHFYRSRGYETLGAPFLDQGIPHVLMRKTLGG